MYKIKRIFSILMAVCLVFLMGSMANLPSTAGSSSVLAASKVRTGTKTSQKKNAKDVKALQKIIKVQIKAGANLTYSLDDTSFYKWGKNGRLERIDWNNRKLSGSISLTAFSELKYFNCLGNKNITKINTSKNKKLTYLSCGDNRIKKLDLRKNTQLITLMCGQNKLSTLDLSKNTKLTNISCMYNELTKLNIRKNKNLTILNCQSNKLSKLDLSGCVNLQKLYCSINTLKTLNTDKNKKLLILDCFCNELKQLDVSKLKNLSSLHCENNSFTKLDINKNKELRELSCSQYIKLTGIPKTCTVYRM